MSYQIKKITPSAERELMIARQKESSVRVEDFHGAPQGQMTLPVIKLAIDIPIYRLENCRTFSAQQTALVKEKLEAKFFENQEEPKTQQRQHEILWKLAKDPRGSVEPINDVLHDQGQREALLITSTGIIVNGNRRLSAMRELLAVGDKDGARFKYVDCQVLPKDTSANEIDHIEATLQAIPAVKLEYDWIGIAQLIRRERQKECSDREIARLLRSKPKIIQEREAALMEAELYLRHFAKAEKQYDLVATSGEQFFKDLPKHLPKNTAYLHAARHVAWSVFHNREHISGRVYDLKNIFEDTYIPNILQKLQGELKISEPQPNEYNGEDFEVEIPSDPAQENFQPILDILLKNEKDTIESVIDACTSEIEKIKITNKNQLPAKYIQKAYNFLRDVTIAEAGKDTFQNIDNYLQSIEEVLIKLKRDLSKAKSNQKE